MNNIENDLKDVCKGLEILISELYGAKWMLEKESPPWHFLEYVRRNLRSIHDEVGFISERLEIKV